MKKCLLIILLMIAVCSSLMMTSCNGADDKDSSGGDDDIEAIELDFGKITVGIGDKIPIPVSVYMNDESFDLRADYDEDVFLFEDGFLVAEKKTEEKTVMLDSEAVKVIFTVAVGAEAELIEPEAPKEREPSAEKKHITFVFSGSVIPLYEKYPLPTALKSGGAEEPIIYEPSAFLEVSEGALSAVEEIKSASLIAYAFDYVIECDFETKDFGAMSAADISVLEFRRADAKISFSDSRYESAVKYYYDGSSIEFNGSRITGIDKDTVTRVTAKSKYHTATFTVTVLPEEKAKMTIEAPEIIYTNYAPKPITVTFLDEAYRSDIYYNVSDSRVKIEDGMIGAEGSFPEEKTVTVTATSEFGYVHSFTVKVAEYNVLDHGTEKKVSYYEKTHIKEENKGGMIFIGDSYFDGYPVPSKNNNPSFWSDFYSDFAGEKAFLMGISQSQIDELTMVSERIVYPMEPKEIVIHIGFNDVYHGNYTVDELYEKITSLIEAFLERLPDTEIYYMGIEPKKNGYTEGTPFYEASTKRAPELTERLVRYIEKTERVTYLETLPVFVNSDGTVNTSSYLATDLSHPTLEAYDKIRAILNEARREKENA
ncbi:MAG: hypothetical protein IJY18_05310 [Clostridia bacterium]|nr:hypothetical protein [Clostridia bacterium]